MTPRPLAALGDESGQGLGEYGLILGFIATVCVAVVLTLGLNIQRLLTRIGTSL